MLSRIKTLSAFALFVLLTSACESFVSDVDGLKSDPKLVVNAYLSPEDDTIKVSVKRSYPLYQLRPAYFEQLDPVKNATVILSEGSNSVTISFSEQYQSYVIAQSNFPIRAGRTYRIEVRASGLETVTAECTVPVQSAPAIEITEIEQLSEYGYSEYRIHFRFRDHSEPGHFYRVAAAQQYNFPEFGVREVWEYFSYKTNRVGAMEGPLELFLFLGLTDEHYFRFHKSVFGYEGDNPFSEPTPIYTNISGGVGVFCAVRKNIVSVNIP